MLTGTEPVVAAVCPPTKAEGRAVRTDTFLRRLLPVLAITVAALAIVEPASADPPSKQYKGDDLAHMLDAGASDAEIRARLGLVKVSTDSPGRQTMSEEWDVRSNIPEIFYDETADSYYATTRFTWLNNDWVGDGRFGGENVGGPDLIAMRVSEAIYFVRGTATTCPSAVSDDYYRRYTCATHTTAYESNVYGVAMRFQDKKGLACKKPCRGDEQEYLSEYNAYSGTLVFEFGWFRRDVCHQFFSYVGHTWDSTSINSVGIGKDSISVGWTSNEHQWLSASNGSGKFWC